MKERIPFVDWLRAVACFMVMLVHASENFYGVVKKKTKTTTFAVPSPKKTSCFQEVANHLGPPCFMVLLVIAY